MHNSMQLESLLFLSRACTLTHAQIIREGAAFTLKTQRENREKKRQKERERWQWVWNRGGLWETKWNEYFSSIFFFLNLISAAVLWNTSMHSMHKHSANLLLLSGRPPSNGASARTERKKRGEDTFEMADVSLCRNFASIFTAEKKKSSTSAETVAKYPAGTPRTLICPEKKIN